VDLHVNMVLADLGRRLNNALSALSRAPVVDEKVGVVSNGALGSDNFLSQVLDATLKEITAALLESDVNVKLVATLRQKVKTKVKSALETSATDNSKEINKKNLIQKVSYRSFLAQRFWELIILSRLFSMSWSNW
jgi:signal recognition particle subunit SRP54